MKNEEEKTKETWEKPKICDLDIIKTAGKTSLEGEGDGAAEFGPGS